MQEYVIFILVSTRRQLIILNKYSKKDKVIGSLAIGATGDAYVELGDIEKGISKYIEAADYAKNSFNTPLFLMKAGEII